MVIYLLLLIITTLATPLRSPVFNVSNPINSPHTPSNSIDTLLRPYTLPYSPILTQHKIYSDGEALVHGKFLTSVFFCIVQVSVLIQRHMKPWKYSSLIHGLLGILILILVHFAVLNLYHKFYVPNADFPPEMLTHVRTGFTLCGLLTAQVILGLITKVLIVYNRSLQLLLLTRKLHHMTGWVIVITGLINLKLGWDISYPFTVETVIYPCYLILVCIYILLEIYRRKSTYSVETHSIRSFNESGMTLELFKQNLSYYEVLKKIHTRGKKWVFFNHLILDMSPFEYSHPGGKYLINGTIGQDVAKYVYGVINYAKEIPPHTHSSQALKLSKKLGFAEVGLPIGVLISKIDESVPLKTTWKVMKTYLVSKEIHCIELTSNEVRINQEPFGYEWMGFHFSIKNSRKLRRFYSLVMVNLKKWSKEVKESGLPVHLSNYGDLEEGESDLKLFIKKYPAGNMSRFLCELPIDSEIKLKGPFGPGLGIYKLPKGPCLAFGAGTGVLTFLDLVYAIWTQRVHSEFYLSLYISFKSRKESVGIDLMQATQKKYRDQFKLQINLDEERIGGRLTEETLGYWVKDDIKKVWVCGPAGFNLWIEETLENYGIAKHNIIIL